MSFNTGRFSGTTGTTGSLRDSARASRNQCTAEHVEITNVTVPGAPLGLTQGFAISLYTSSTGRLAILQLLSIQERMKMVEELLTRNKQNLNVRPSGARCLCFNISLFLLSKLSGPFSSYVEQRLLTALNLHKCKPKGPKCDCAPLKNFIGSALIIIGRARAKVKNRDSTFDGIGGLPKGVPVVNWFGERFSVVRLKLVSLNV